MTSDLSGILTQEELSLIRQDIDVVLRDQRCDILRNAGTTDVWGHKTVNWQPHLVDVACKLTTSSGREVVGSDINVEKTTHYLDMAYGTDVTNLDKVTNIRNQLGDVLLNEMRVTAVIVRSTHLLVYGEAYRA